MILLELQKVDIKHTNLQCIALIMWRQKEMIKKITTIQVINPVAKEAWKKKYTVIPNKKKKLPKKYKYQQED